MKRILFTAFTILLVLSSAWSCSPSAAVEESITVAHAQFESTALLSIALDQQIFSKNGLNVTTQKFDTGAGALDAVVKGDTDIAVGTAEFPVVGRAFKKEKIQIIGSIDRADFIYLIGRKDHGITEVSDLKGKKVGTAFGTIAEFFLGRFLTLNGLNTQDVTLVDLATPGEWVNSIANGDVDAIAIAQPHARLIQNQLGENAVVWPAQNNQPLYTLVIASNEWIALHPEPIRRFLKALAQAEEFLIRNPDKAKAIVQQQLSLDAGYMDTVWSQNHFSLFLDQSMILAMEDEARWMIQNEHTTEGQVPDFLDYIYEDGLKAIKPHAVNILR